MFNDIFTSEVDKSLHNVETISSMWDLENGRNEMRNQKDWIFSATKQTISIAQNLLDNIAECISSFNERQ